MSVIELRVEGRPHGKGRPRFARGRTFTDAKTEAAEARVERAWEQAGKPRLPDGPIVLLATLVVARPRSHYRSDGVTLSAAGERHPLPRVKPDIDNAVKLVMDACNGLVYRDDVDIVEAHVSRRWAAPGESEHTLVRLAAARTAPVFSGLAAVFSGVAA